MNESELAKLLRKEAEANTSNTSKEDYYRKQRAVKMVNDYLAVKKAREELMDAGIKTTKNNLVEYFVKTWESNKSLADEEEI